MISLLVGVVLAMDPMDVLTPPPPPPQVQPTDAAKSPASQVETEPDPDEAVPAEVLADVDTSRPGLRVTGALVGTFIGLLVSGASGLGAGFVVAAVGGNSAGGYASISALTVGVLSCVFVDAALAYFGERTAGGKGTWLAALAGSATGAAVGGGLASLGVFLLVSGRGLGIAGAVAITLGVGTVLFAPYLALERSHAMYFAKAVPSVGFMPTKNGGVVALGWRF